MRLIFTALMMSMFLVHPILEIQDSCLESFHNFETVKAEVNPTVRNVDYEGFTSLAWYGECMLVGSANGLMLYDIQRPYRTVILANINDRVITHVAVNPNDMTIAFNVDQEPTIYFISPEHKVSTWMAEGDAINDISFSPDGSLMAIASAKIMGEETELAGLYYDSNVQILDSSQTVVATIPSDLDSSAAVTIVTETTFGGDNKHLFTYNFRPGYYGDKVTYWDIYASKKVWNYDDLFANLDWMTETDPLWITNASMSDHIVALGGIDRVHDWDDYAGTAVHLWDVDTQQRLGYAVISRRSRTYNEPLTDLAFTHESSVFVTGQSNGMVRFWNTKNATEMTGSIQLSSSISQLLFDSSDRYLAILTDDEVSVWDINLSVIASAFHVDKSK